jgi:hypothetical protein
VCAIDQLTYCFWMQRKAFKANFPAFAAVRLGKARRGAAAASDSDAGRQNQTQCDMLLENTAWRARCVMPLSEMVILCHAAQWICNELSFGYPYPWIMSRSGIVSCEVFCSQASLFVSSLTLGQMGRKGYQPLAHQGWVTRRTALSHARFFGIR